MHCRKDGFTAVGKKVCYQLVTVLLLEHNTYWSSTMTSSCWVYCRARRRARSLASDLHGENMCREICLMFSRNTVLWDCGCLKRHYSPRVYKVEDTQFIRQGGSQAVCIHHYVVVKESSICVEEVHLCCCNLCNTWMTVAHCTKKHTVIVYSLSMF